MQETKNMINGRESVEDNKELVRTLGRTCVGEGMDVGKAIEAVTSSVMMVIHVPGVVHDAKNSSMHFIHPS